VDVPTYQARVLARLGDDLTDRQLNVALGTLIGEASAVRTLVSLDGHGERITDEDLIGQFGNLLLALAEAACVLGVDLERAMAWGERAAEARAAWDPIAVNRMLVSKRGE
jgi:hypothetical protein